jgi:hypothetical protein
MLRISFQAFKYIIDNTSKCAYSSFKICEISQVLRTCKNLS